MPAMFASAEGSVGPELMHRARKVHDDVFAIEDLVVDEVLALLAVEDEMFGFARGTPTLDHESDCVWTASGRVNDIWRDEEHLTLFDDVVTHPSVLDGLDDDVALQLKKKLLTVDLVEVVSRVWPDDDHDEKVATGIQVLVRDWRFEMRAVGSDPRKQVKRRKHFAVRPPTTEVIGGVWVRDDRRLVRRGHGSHGKHLQVGLVPTQ